MLTELPENGCSLRGRLGKLERELIWQALARSSSITEAAKLLRLNRTTLTEKLRKHSMGPYSEAEEVLPSPGKANGAGQEVEPAGDGQCCVSPEA